MARAKAGILIVLLLATLVPLAPDAAAAPTSRAPISITGDAGFTFSNGVRSGTGSPLDPYVISDWTIDAASGAAVRITGTTKHVVLRDLTLTSGSGASAVDLRDNTDTVEVRDVTANHRGFGVNAQNGRVVLDRVVVRDLGSPGFSGAGVSARGGHVYVGNSTFISNDQMLRLTDTRALIEGALAVSGFDGIVVNGGFVSVVDAEVQVRGYAVHAEGGANVSVAASLLTRPERGVFARNSVVTLDGVRVEAATAYAAWLENSRSRLASVSVAGGSRGVFVLHGRADVATSDFDSVAGTGVRFLDAAGSVDASTFLRNGGGVAVDGGSLVQITSSLFSSNDWGVGIDYAARASIPLLSGNVVNGLPLAGVYRWAEANVVFAGSLDSGHSAGYSGSMSREGQLVLYDVQEAYIDGTLSHGTRGVYAVNSFNVVVESSVILSNLCGVVFNGTVGFVKNSTIDIPVDPPTTCGVSISGGFAGVVNNTIRRVDVGVLVNAGAKVNISGNLVTETYLGIVLDGGSPGNVTVEGNAVVGNTIGLDVRARFRGDVVANTIRANAHAGVRISGGAALDFRANVVVHNGRGIEDVTACASANVVSHFSDNVVSNNSEFGAMVNGTVVARNNTFSDNGGDGLVVCGRLDGRFDVYARNGEDGLEVTGSADLAAETSVHNRFGAGLRLRGTLFVMVFMNVTANFDGIIGTEVILPPLPPVPPVTVPPVGVPSVPPVPRLPGCLVACQPPDPIWIHLSTIAHNTRFAISATLHTDVNATNNHWGSPQAPRHSVPQVGEFGNRISANVRFVPWFRDAAMTDSAPV